ncbi:MAG: hypothetical protein DCC68_08070 [Planctomycetota bacterium]|nr:MAG: hypothetical protein DCC68_08070 [Planctomycetota bacterium]
MDRSADYLGTRRVDRRRFSSYAAAQRHVRRAVAGDVADETEPGCTQMARTRFALVSSAA